MEKYTLKDILIGTLSNIRVILLTDEDIIKFIYTDCVGDITTGIKYNKINMINEVVNTLMDIKIFTGKITFENFSEVDVHNIFTMLTLKHDNIRLQNELSESKEKYENLLNKVKN